MKPAVRKMMAERLAQAEAFLVRALRKTNYIGRRRLPPGIRSLVGVLCIIGGFLGFLPILGYWMVPVGTVRQVTRNVKRWRHAEMALRWTAAGLLEAQKTFRRLKAYRQLPILRNALQEHLRKAQADSAIETIMKAA